MELKQSNAIVTGAGAGIGQECALRLAKENIFVNVTDINLDDALVVAHQIKKAGGSAKAWQLDVTKYAEVNSTFQEIYKEQGKLDILVNNAGVMNRKRSRTHDHSLEDWDFLVSVNQTGVFYCMKVALGLMMESNSGSIVNIASLAGLKASGYNIAYSASKFAVVGMTKSAAIEYGSKGIRVNAVCPSYTDTQMLRTALEGQDGFEEKLLHFTPMKRFGTPKEVAEAVYWLASEKSSFTTGHTLTLDGGLSL